MFSKQDPEPRGWAAPAPPSCATSTREAPPARSCSSQQGLPHTLSRRELLPVTAPNSPSPCPGPGHSLGAVVDQDALTDGEGAVVPHQEEVKDGVCHPGSHRAGCEGTCGGTGTVTARGTATHGQGPAPHHPAQPQRPPHLQDSALPGSGCSRMG